jgi:hypothetical protein
MHWVSSRYQRKINPQEFENMGIRKGYLRGRAWAGWSDFWFKTSKGLNGGGNA